MTTGSVNPFLPSQPTQVLTVGTSSAVATFEPTDSVLLYNTGTIAVFVELSTSVDPPTASVSGSVPVPPGGTLLLGLPGAVGTSPQVSGQIPKLAYIAAASGPVLYVTPGMGTQR